MPRANLRQWVLIAAYDTGMRNSEGYVARSLLEWLDPELRVILITRKNNVAELLSSPDFKVACPNVHLVGYDLPRWASWWKKGPRGYGLYSYLWQITWPFVLKSRRKLVDRCSVIHTLNFHNDSIPSMAWTLGKPSVWGPINHNEGLRSWRMRHWPLTLRIGNALKAAVRSVAWRFDPLLAISIRKTDVVFSAGSWVDNRLRLKGRANVRHRSQLGLEVSTFNVRQRTTRETGLRLVSGGRLDWIKGLDLALDALAHLPHDTTLTLIGDGPCKSFLLERASWLGVNGQVKIVPSVSRSQLLRHYADHDIFLFPSAEAGGLAWVEALAMGLPVVGVKGPTELSEMASILPGIVMSDDLGKYSENARSLAQAIKIVSAQDYNPKEISRAVQKHYGWSNFADEVQIAYRTAKGVEK